MGNYDYENSMMEPSGPGSTESVYGRDTAESTIEKGTLAGGSGGLPSGMKRCKVCGRPVAKTAASCPHCGARQKAGIIPIAAAAVVALILVIAAFGSKKTSSAGTEPAKETAAPTEAQAEPAADSSDSVTADEKRQLQDTLLAIIQANLDEESKSMFDMKWDYEKDTLVVNTTVDGISEAITLNKDNAELRGVWNNLCESMKSTCSTMYNSLQKGGLEGSHVSLNLLSDSSPNAPLLSVYDDGIIVYNILDD